MNAKESPTVPLHLVLAMVGGNHDDRARILSSAPIFLDYGTVSGLEELAKALDFMGQKSDRWRKAQYFAKMEFLRLGGWRFLDRYGDPSSYGAMAKMVFLDDCPEYELFEKLVSNPYAPMISEQAYRQLLEELDRPQQRIAYPEIPLPEGYVVVKAPAFEEDPRDMISPGGYEEALTKAGMETVVLEETVAQVEPTPLAVVFPPRNPELDRNPPPSPYHTASPEPVVSTATTIFRSSQKIVLDGEWWVEANPNITAGEFLKKTHPDNTRVLVEVLRDGSQVAVHRDDRIFFHSNVFRVFRLYEQENGEPKKIAPAVFMYGLDGEMVVASKRIMTAEEILKDNGWDPELFYLVELLGSSQQESYENKNGTEFDFALPDHRRLVAVYCGSTAN
jgi:hypothetical protein